MKEMKILSEWAYSPCEPYRGYTGKTLYVNVGNLKFAEKNVTEEMKEKFVGGRGFGLKLLWDAVRDETRWNDPENEIVISRRPALRHNAISGSGKYYAVFISP